MNILEFAKSHEMVVVREMVNTPRGIARKILNQAFSNSKFTATTEIFESSVQEENYALSKSNYIIAPSQAVQDALLDSNVSDENIFSASFGWDPELISEKPRHHTDARMKALFLGRVSVRKGFPILIEAWRNAAPRAVLVVGGQIEDGLDGLVNEGVADGLIDYRGFVKDVPSLLRECDFLVFPTIEEGAPLVVYEACGAGLPVLTTHMGAARIIEHGINGLILPPHDSQAWARAISYVSSSPDWLESASTEAVHSADRFTWRAAATRRLMLLDPLATVPRTREQIYGLESFIAARD